MTVSLTVSTRPLTPSLSPQAGRGGRAAAPSVTLRLDRRVQLADAPAGHRSIRHSLPLSPQAGRGGRAAVASVTLRLDRRVGEVRR